MDTGIQLESAEREHAWQQRDFARPDARRKAFTITSPDGRKLTLPPGV